MGTEVADGEGDGVPHGSHDSSGRARITVAEVARALGISDSAVRKRVKRGKLEHERTPDGRVFVYLDDAATSASGRDGSRGVGNLRIRSNTSEASSTGSGRRTERAAPSSRGSRV
jgi:excisionase family DNA binding protein